MTTHNQDLDHNYVVILAGGSGTRLWPRSRGDTPKQFLKLVGSKTMLQLTADRARQLVNWDRIIIVTNQAHLKTVKAQLPQVKTAQILLEPEKKDTAMAMLAGALYAYTLDPEAVIINSASDHYVATPAEFVRVMRQACQIAANHQDLITVGIAPNRPETGFGYIKVGEQINDDGHAPVFKVDSFTEKPNAATAAAFIATGKYFWNANMYVWSSQALITAFKNYAPKIYQAAAKLATTKPKDFQAVMNQIYPQVDAISIDYAISEKAKNLLLLPGSFGWSDVGDWRITYELGEKDQDRNVHIDETGGKSHLLAQAARKNLLSSSSPRLVALLGVKDLVVVDTPEILLVTTQEHAQEVKKIVEGLKQNKQKQYL